MAGPKIVDTYGNSNSANRLDVYTNMKEFTTRGTVDVGTQDILVQVNGAAYSSDPSLISLDGTSWVFPNLNYHPAGHLLNRGLNTISFVSVASNGAESNPTTLYVTLRDDYEFDFNFSAPTGVSLNRYSNYIELVWSDVATSGASGYNVYASTGAGGTGSGFLKLNAELIASNNYYEMVTDILNETTAQYDWDQSSGSMSVSVVVDEVDSASGQVLNRKSKNVYDNISSSGYRTVLTFAQTRKTKIYKYQHNRDLGITSGFLNNESFTYLDDTTPLYYIITAVFFDGSNDSFLESNYSSELVGSPLPLNNVSRGLPIRTSSQIVTEYIELMGKSAPGLSLIPGSTIREIHVEPLSIEMQKAYFLMDFIHRSKSFPALLDIDDPMRSGVSLPVADSSYKTSLKATLAATDDDTVQALINLSFDNLAQNYGVYRRGKTNAVINQTFYLNSLPRKPIFISQNSVVTSSTGTGVRFYSQGQSSITPANASSFYNPTTRRYEITIPMVCELPGSVGNVAPYTLDVIVSGATQFSGTMNEASASGGRDIMSNLELAETAMRAISSVDSGTYGGIFKAVSAVPGVSSFSIVKSGDPYMWRDYDEDRGIHTGGKVDVYIFGSIDRTITERFASNYSIQRNVRFDVIDPINFKFRARDSRITIDNPLKDIINNSANGFGLRNYSNGTVTYYDVSNIDIQGNVITLKNGSQPLTNWDDYVLGDVRFEKAPKFVPSIQPVRSISSIVGLSSSGTLDSANGYSLFKLQDPLIDGESTKSSDYVQIIQNDGVPDGISLMVNDEVHTLSGSIPDPLFNVGVNLLTVKVFPFGRAFAYNGPYDSDPDYLIIPGSDKRAPSIVRTPTSNIQPGATVYVDYEHDENFNITYVVNDILQRVQNNVDAVKHITADIVVKQAPDNNIQLDANVSISPGFQKASVDINIRSAISAMVNRKKVGEDVHVSDIIAAIDGANGVDYVNQPFNRMSLTDGSVRIRDEVPMSYRKLNDLSAYNNSVYLMTEPLPYSTTDGGGTTNIHRGVYKDGIVMEESSSLGLLNLGPNRFYIIGSTGMQIEGYTDNPSLAAIDSNINNWPALIASMTANRVVISLNSGDFKDDLPESHEFTATYVVYNDFGVKDILVSQIENLNVGTMTFTIG